MATDPNNLSANLNSSRGTLPPIKLEPIAETPDTAPQTDDDILKYDMNQSDQEKMMETMNMLWRDQDKIVETVNMVWDDREKIMGAVNMVWEDREKITGAVNLVWENQDGLMSVLNYVLEHRDKITDLIQQLPALLGRTGDMIESAGVSAMQASSFLTGDDAEESLSARDLAELAASALERCQKELKAAAGVMESVGGEIDDVKIPTITPEYTKVMGFNVVSGVEFGESDVVDNAAERLKRGANRLEDIGGDLSTVAVQMRKLGQVLTGAGSDLNGLGHQLKQSGGTLRELTQLTSTPIEQKAESAQETTAKA